MLDLQSVLVDRVEPFGRPFAVDLVFQCRLAPGADVEGLLDFEPAVLGFDAVGLCRRRVESRGDAGQRAVVVLQDSGHVGVDAAIATVPRPRVHAVRLPEEQSSGADRVTADVHDATARELRIEADVVRTPSQGELERRVDGVDALEFLVDDLGGALGAGMEAVHERLHQRHATVVAVVVQRRGGVGVRGQRFLTEDVQACVGGLPGPLVVECVGKGIVDRVQVIVFE